MNYLPFTLLAYGLNCLAVLVDKYLLNRHIQHPLLYVFYFSLFSAIALLFLPFVSPPAFATITIASLSTLLWTSAAYCMYWALQKGSPTRIIPLIGALVPLILLGVSHLTSSITSGEIHAIILLLIGMVFLVLPDWHGKPLKNELFLVCMSSVLFAVSYMVLRMAFLQSSFLSVLVWSRLILLPVGLVLVLYPATNKILFMKGTNKGFSLASRSGLLFLLGQLAGGASELLLIFSVSLANPALVNSLQGTQYALLFIASFFLSRKMPHVFEDNHSLLTIVLKVIGLVILGIGLFKLAFQVAS